MAELAVDAPLAAFAAPKTGVAATERLDELDKRGSLRGGRIFGHARKPPTPLAFPQA
jgi:hypothetical protein